MAHSCVMPETTSPPTEVPSSPLGSGGTRRLAHTLCCFGTEELAGPSWARGILRRAVVCSSSGSWHSAFGVMLLTRSWALWKGPARSV